MRVVRLFLKLCFIACLLILVASCKTRESESLRVGTYLSNYGRSGDFTVSLDNDYGSFALLYDQYFFQVKVHLRLKNQDNITIKNIKFNGEDVCVADDFYRPSIMEEGHFEYELDPYHCKTRWKKLIEESNGGDLKFSVIVSETDSGLEKIYEFQISKTNMSLLAEIMDIDNV
ncbi:hypothetical protein bcCo53_001196 (plasmid) [Borrelia coriaceae]|uniref:Lipoprotein n=1 Tax=Borrelia coriaceae ATCC 43381 TaxID=1408429 RepID=W5SVY4_9SPIR|nr:hypothetical protein [Borrelia coriaceae]AHH11095.1 hypothetical protein BCO_0000804 [Borrelia coriaceae ATCC 43381]UPA17027.1 hypothetical protein bcCo53_001196 [Borrelia coriaceae]